MDNLESNALHVERYERQNLVDYPRVMYLLDQWIERWYVTLGRVFRSGRAKTRKVAQRAFAHGLQATIDRKDIPIGAGSANHRRFCRS
jgi:hypothetical protein